MSVAEIAESSTYLFDIVGKKHILHVWAYGVSGGFESILEKTWKILSSLLHGITKVHIPKTTDCATTFLLGTSRYENFKVSYHEQNLLSWSLEIKVIIYTIKPFCNFQNLKHTKWPSTKTKQFKTAKNDTKDTLIEQQSSIKYEDCYIKHVVPLWVM